MDKYFDLTLKTLNFVMKTLEAKGFYSIWHHPKWLSYVFPIHLNTCVMGPRSLEIVLLLQRGDRL